MIDRKKEVMFAMKKLIQFVKENNEKIILLTCAVYFFLAPFSVSRLYQKLLPLPLPMSVFISFLTCCIMVFVYIVTKNKGFYFLRDFYDQKLFILSIYVPAGVSIFAAIYNLTVIRSVEYVQYFTHSLPTRLINMVLFLIIFVVFTKLLKRLTNEMLFKIANSYVLGVFVIYVVGIWQFLHFTLNFPMPDIHTRSFVHSVDEKVLFDFRLTSLVDEPSYLVPLVIDGLLIAFFLYGFTKKYIFRTLIPGLFVLIFSFSVSGYANILLIISFIAIVLLTTKINNKVKIIQFGLFSILLIAIFAIVAKDFLIEFLMPIIGRFDTLLDIHKHSRLYMTVMPFIWLFDYSFINAIFGFGPGAYDFLSLTKFLHHRGPVSTTSNNIYIDFLFEHGIFGAIFYLSVFLYIFYQYYKKRNVHSYYLYSLILLFHLAVTSMYRSDFVSPRFWVIILIITIFTELARRDLKKGS
jgi:hypothetical protein